MPRITQVARPSVSGVDFSTGDTSRQRAAVKSAEAQGLVSLGQGLSSFASGLNTYNKSRAKLDDNLALKENETASRLAAQTVVREATADKKRLADGSDLLANGTKSYTKIRDGFLKEIKDPDVRRQAELSWDKSFLAVDGSLGTVAQQEHLQFQAKKGDQLLDSTNQLLSMDPSAESLADANNTLEELYQGQRDGLMISDAQRDVLVKNARRATADTVVNSLIRKGNFKEAKARIISGDLSGEYGINAKGQDERDLKLKQIKQARLQHINIQLQEENLADKKTQKVRKEISRDALTDLLTLSATEDIPPEKIRKRANDLLKNDTISRSDYALANNVLDGTTGGNDDNIEFSVTSKLMDGQSIEKLKAEVKSSVNAGDLSSERGTRVLKTLTEAESRKSAGSSKAYNRDLKNAQGMLDAVFGSKTMFDTLDGSAPKKLLRQEAQESLNNRIRNNPDNLTPQDMAREVVLEFEAASDLTSKRTPQIAQYGKVADLNDLGDIEKKIYLDFKQKKISASKLKFLLQTTKSLRARMTLEEERKRNANKDK